MKPAKQRALKPAGTVGAYIAAFPAEVRQRLLKVRRAIKKAVPEAEESISYRIPAYKLNGPLLYFAAHKAHIGLYPMVGEIKDVFAKELAGFPQSKGTLKLPHDKPIPYALIGKIAKFRAKENAAAATAKRKKA